MKTVTVMFSINGTVSFQTAVDYFVGQWFNLGKGEADNMQQCTAIVFE